VGEAGAAHGGGGGLWGAEAWGAAAHGGGGVWPGAGTAAGGWTAHGGGGGVWGAPGAGWAGAMGGGVGAVGPGADCGGRAWAGAGWAPVNSAGAWNPHDVQNRAPGTAGQRLPQRGQKAIWGCGVAPGVMDTEDLLGHPSARFQSPSRLLYCGAAGGMRSWRTDRGSADTVSEASANKLKIRP
jgi:hypothetical protein